MHPLAAHLGELVCQAWFLAAQMQAINAILASGGSWGNGFYSSVTLHNAAAQTSPPQESEPPAGTPHSEQV